ncbi:MAG TPA: LysR family transcriptional regulator [Stenotrophobium sp.]|nr:LysR family transcriptional regulator [Stenotrophobium sp.]
MAINFNLNDLQAFRAVAELSSFRKAADALHVSQPAFSRRIEKLEEALGVRLLERTTRSVSLTTVGREFDRKVQQLLDDLDNTLLGIRGVAGTRMGEVTIACVPSTVYYFLSHVISRYHERFPKIRVKVIDASANEVLAAVSGGDADFGINFIGGQEADIEFKLLVEERFVAACRRDHELAGKRRVSWSELSRYDYISVSKASGNRLLLDQALAGISGLPQIIYETQHVTAMLGLVEAGLGVAAVPAMAMPVGEHPLLLGIPLVDPVVTRKVGLIRRKGRSLSPAAQQLYEFFPS